MADIFISYAREDRAVAALLARALERRGWSVWWDRIIPPGKTFDEVIETELSSARCAIVLWSKAAILSRWVRDEAQAAINGHKLVPAILDGVEPPMGFRRIQAADLVGWRGDDGHTGWQDLRNAVGDLLTLRHEAGAAGVQNFEPPQNTVYSTTKPTGARIITALPLWARHGTTLLCGYIVSNFLRIDSAYTNTAVIAFFVSLAAAVGLLGIWVPKTERWRLCSRQVVLYCLPLVAAFSIAIVIEKNRYPSSEWHPPQAYFVIAILSSLMVLAASLWMWRARTRRRAD